MDRRVFLGALAAGSLLAAPLAAEPQQAGKVPRVGYLLPSRSRPSNAEFFVGLRNLGYIDGKNILIERSRRQREGVHVHVARPAQG